MGKTKVEAALGFGGAGGSVRNGGTLLFLASHHFGNANGLWFRITWGHYLPFSLLAKRWIQAPEPIDAFNLVLGLRLCQMVLLHWYLSCGKMHGKYI
jgi:hypothetical protein